MGDRLATIDMGRDKKNRGVPVPPFLEGQGYEKIESRSNCREQALTWNGPS